MKRKIYQSILDKIWGDDLEDMQLISKYNKRVIFMLWNFDIYSIYAWVVPLKDRKGITIANTFQKNIEESGRKPKKILPDQGSEFYIRSMKSQLYDNGIEIYSALNKWKSVVAERFIRTLKNKIYKHMAAVSENVYIEKLDERIDKYNKTYLKTIKMMYLGVNSGTYNEHCVEYNDKDPKYKVGDHMRILKYKIFSQRECH